MSVMTEAPGVTRRNSRMFLQNDFQQIKDTYSANACLFEEMSFASEDDAKGWSKLAKSFLLDHKRETKNGMLVLKNPKIEKFVRDVGELCRRREPGLGGGHVIPEIG